MSSSIASARTESSYSSYGLPLLAAIALHLFVFWLFAGGFDGLRLKQAPEQKVYKVIKASLVTLKQKKSAPKVVKKKTVAKKPAKAKPQQKTKVEKALAEKSKPIEKNKAEDTLEEEAVASSESLLEDLFADEDQALAEDQELAEVAAYIQAMKQTIEQNWSRPPSARNSMQAILVILLVPNGDVVSVTIREGSGNGAFDRAAVLAVERVGRFDFLNKMSNTLFEKHFRQIALTFKPEDLRL